MDQKNLKELFERHCSRIDFKIEQLKDCSKKFSWLRAIVFLLIVAFGYFTAGLLNDYIYMLGLIGGVGGFLFLVDRHYKVHQSIEKFGYLKEIKKEHIARLELNWKEIPSRRFEADIKDHAYAKDLDIVGPYSLHHLLDTSIYEGSTRLLLDWLMREAPDKKEITERQKLVKELIPLQGFRDKLAVIGKYTVMHTSEKDWTMDRMLAWLRKPARKGFMVPLVLLSLLSLSNITLAILAWIGIVNPVFPVITLVLYLSIYKFNSDKISGLFEAAYQMDKLLGRFRELLLQVEQFRVTKSESLKQFLEVFHNSETKPSYYLKKVEKLTGAASLQANQVVWPLVNLVIPWDMYYSMKLENLKEELEPRLSKWLDVFYELEALNSIANFGALHEEYNFPDLTNDSQTLFETKEIGHPLIPSSQKVTNNFIVKEDKDLFLITGSNMAGKSTFLRTIGINLCLAFAGAPVNAASLKTNLFRIFTSINVKDSLEGGLSHFYAEVRRLRTLLNKLESEHELPLFFFVDEIFKGTNNRERFQGSTAFLKEIAGKNGVGMVSTHDLELASLEKEIPELSNWHFAETIEGGKMSFEYKLKKGPCPTTNALKIMELEGLPVK
ncbi:hypothetical protein [Gracilimonas sp.]|uniref:MutS-related protein n=1 Tax=Gracilimonas sp. TaxID=1974203 RepID=UPI0032EF9E62